MSLVIFQNYYTPYRDKFFNLLAKQIDLKVIYMHTPQDEGRLWEFNKDVKRSYKSIFLKYKKIKNIFTLHNLFIFNNLFEVKKYIEKEDTVIFLDNLPTNLSLILISLFVKIRSFVWIEHVDFKYFDSLAKKMFRKLFTWFWLCRVKGIFYFSADTSKYIKSISKYCPKKHEFHRLYTTSFTISDIERLDKQVKVTDFIGTVNFGLYSYFNERKNIEKLMINFIELKDKMPYAKLFIAGDGPLKSKLIKVAKKDSRIVILPYLKTLEDKKRFLENLHIFVFPTLKDPWGLVVNEALAYKTPVLCSKYAGSRELVKKASDQLIFDAFNDKSFKKALLNSYRLVINDYQNYMKIVNKSLQVLKEYSLDKSVEKIVTAVKECAVVSIKN